MKLKDKTYQLQSELAGYCRNGQPVHLPVDSDKRLSQYRRLVFNVIKGTLDQAYPIAAKHLGQETWYQLVHDFFTDHPCRDPQVWKMPKELIEYVEDTHYDERLKKPHFLDLLTMEWLEIEVHSMPDLAAPEHVEIEDILHESLVYNPHYRLQHFKFPVHKIHQLAPDEHPGSYFLLVFREESSGRVQFIHLQQFFAALIDSMLQNPGTTAAEIYAAMCSAVGRSTDSTEAGEIKGLLEHLLNKNFVLGRAMV